MKFDVEFHNGKQFKLKSVVRQTFYYQWSRDLIFLFHIGYQKILLEIALIVLQKR